MRGELWSDEDESFEAGAQRFYGKKPDTLLSFDLNYNLAPFASKHFSITSTAGAGDGSGQEESDEGLGALDDEDEEDGDSDDSDELLDVERKALEMDRDR